MNSLPQEEKYFPVPEPETNFSVFGNESKIVPEVEPEPFADLIPIGEPEPVGEIEPIGEPEPTAEGHIVMTIVAVLAGIIGFIIMFENVLVLLTLAKGKPRQRRSLSYFIGNMAVADFVAGFHLVWFLCFDYFLITHKPLIYIIVMCSLWLVTVVVSVISLFNFALMRLRIARSHETYKLTRRGAIITIVLSWVLPVALLVVPPMVGWNCVDCKDDCSCSLLLNPFTKNYILILAVMIVVAIISLFVIYLWIVHAVHSKIDKLKKKGNIKRKETQLVHSILLILVLFSVCILPIGVCLFVDYFCAEANQTLRLTFPILVVLSFINSACNPFIYIWRLRSMKSALWRLFGRKGMIPENSSLKQIVLWKMSTKRKRPTSSGSPKSKLASESFDKLSPKFTTSLDTITNKA